MNDEKQFVSGEELLYFSNQVKNPPFDFFDTQYPKNTKPKIIKPAKKNCAKGFFVVLGKIIATLLIISIIFVSGYMVVSAANQQYGQDGFQIEISNFGKNPQWMPSGNTDEVNGIYAMAEERGALATAYEIYELACKRLNLSQKYAIRAIGNITTNASLGGLNAMVKVNSNRLENYEVTAQPTLNANQPRIYSNMDINYPVDSDGEAWLVSIIQMSSVESIRAYFDGEYVYEQRSKNMIQNEEEEFEIVWPEDYERLEGDFERSYEDYELREKANFVINTDTIVEDTVEIEAVDENGVKRYDVYFELDCENTDPGSATYYEAEAIKRKMGQSQKFTFSYMDVSFSVYENGYMTHWTTNQHYRITQDLGPLGQVVIAAQNHKREAISYDPDDCQIVNFLEEQED